MVWKKVPPGDAGATDIFGGDDMNKVSDAFSGADVDDIDLNSDFSVRSGKRYLRNPANTFSYQEIASAIAANRTVTEPLLTGNDTRVYQAHTQPLTNKTISGASNTLSNIPVNSLSNFAIASPLTDQVIQYNGTNWVNATSSAGVTASSTATFTNKEIDLDGTGNKLRHVNQPTWTIYKTAIGGTIKAYNNETGIVDFSHASELDTVLQGVLSIANYKTVYLSDWLGSNSIYPISSGFTGFQMGYRTHLIMGKNARIRVPNGWTGNVITLYNTATRTCADNTIEGGWFYEDGTPQRLWSGYFLYTDKLGTGNDMNNIRGTAIFDCNIGIELGIGNMSTQKGWMNGNTFKDFIIWYANIAIDFADYSPGNNLGINRTYFENIISQGAPHTTFGVRNIKHQSNVFVDCKMWDMDGVDRTCSIVTSSDGTQIYGGIMGYTGANGYTDSSTLQNTTIIDQWNRKFGYLTARSKAGDPTTTELPASQYQVWKNTTSGAVKLWYNDAGTMKASVALV